ncbi:hypothetical protein [Microbacterium kunmingense]|uniref:hypothetical protein n=1 Tax=Microbacterium kunmingense TaxID=2915939 RepID=UPI00200361E5|nr:hypothetical protein [Microbacterium kunmingense]
MATITVIENRIDEIRNKATQIRNTTAQTIREVRADARTTADAKNDAVAELSARANTAIQAAHDEELALLDTEITSREWALFRGLGTTSADIIAQRDAEDRARRIDTEREAREILDTAVASADHSMALAVFRAAIRQGWGNVITAFTKRYPDKATAADELANLTHFRDNNDFERMGIYFPFSAPNDASSFADRGETSSIGSTPFA